MTEHKEVSAWLQAMELDVSDPDKLFLLIDSSRRGWNALMGTFYAQHGMHRNLADCAALVAREPSAHLRRRQDNPGRADTRGRQAQGLSQKLGCSRQVAASLKFMRLQA